MPSSPHVLFPGLLFLLLFHLPQGHAQSLELISWNIRYDNPDDGPDRWEVRRGEVTQLLDFYHPAAIGLQEVLAHQLQYLDSCLTDYAFVGVGRDDGKSKGEFTPILFDTTRVRLIKHGAFWLSPTPGKVSTGWDAALPRICTWALLQRRSSGQRFWVFNTHFDHRGEVAREKSALLLLQQIEEKNTEQLPVVLMGDLNALPDSRPLKLLGTRLQDAHQQCERPFYGPQGTFSGFNTDAVPKGRIDYILLQKATINACRHIDDRRRNNHWPSDHLPVWSRLAFENH